MDIVTRIKTFLNIQGFAVSQFADKCEIPRPTVSQLLNGRNKKVSDEIISKIHIAYPNLSIMWLMFGEEPMLLANGVVENKDLGDSDVLSFELFDEDNENPDNDTINLKNQNVRGLNDGDLIDFNSVISDKSDLNKSPIQKNEQVISDIRKIIKAPECEKTNQKQKISEKEIVNIMVFYSDNSFESFRPNGR